MRMNTCIDGHVYTGIFYDVKCVYLSRSAGPSSGHNYGGHNYIPVAVGQAIIGRCRREVVEAEPHGLNEGSRDPMVSAIAP